MRASEVGSLTKETPLEKLDQTIEAVTPGMAYSQLLDFARRHTHRDAPGLVRKRFLLVDPQDIVRYDRFLSLANAERMQSPRVRKVMYFVWAFRDERLRRFICEVVANAAGKWRIAELTKKSNAEFFRHWFSKPSTTPAKARSNIEFFLAEAGIYDAAARAIHLELEDGWLTEAMQVAAQHETSVGRRRAMTGAPVEFLIASGWHGLANATVDELRAVSPSGTSDTEPLEDDQIDVDPAAALRGRPWTDREPGTSGRPPRQVFTNEVARERATRAHLAIERITAAAARVRGYEPRSTDNIDMYFQTEAATVLAEMKSCHEKNLHAQVRRGVSQLLEYRYTSRNILREQVTLLLVIETRPSREKDWLVDCLRSLGIVLAWKDPGGSRLLTTTAIPRSLTGVVFPQP